MSQGDLLMQRKRHNNGEMADAESARHFSGSGATTLQAPLRKSLADAPHFIESLKKNAGARGRPSICLTSPTSGSMDTGYAEVKRSPDPIVVSRHERQAATIEQRQREEDAMRVHYDTARAEYHAMLREKERIRLRQRTQARLELENLTLPTISGSARTMTSLYREASKSEAHQSFVEKNRDRIEVNIIRRVEERDAVRRRQMARQTLEERSGTAYALSQSRLRETIGTDLMATAIVTPEEAHSVLQHREQEELYEHEERKNIDAAMKELDELDQRLYKEEMARREVRLAKKKELRAASVRK